MTTRGLRSRRVSSSSRRAAVEGLAASAVDKTPWKLTPGRPSMATYATATGATGFLPVDTGPLVIQPLFDASVFAQVATRQITNSHTYRIPTVVADPVAAWVAEGAEITPSDP